MCKAICPPTLKAGQKITNLTIKYPFQVFGHIDKDLNGQLSWEELYMIDMNAVTQFLSDVFNDIENVFASTSYPNIKSDKDGVKVESQSAEESQKLKEAETGDSHGEKDQTSEQVQADINKPDVEQKTEESAIEDTFHFVSHDDLYIEIDEKDMDKKGMKHEELWCYVY